MNIFCIGCAKTASSSLGEAMTILGFTSHRMDGRVAHVEELSEIEPHDAVSDNPADHWYYKLTLYPRRFKELDRRFPGSKFILTTRDLTSWVKSIKHNYRVTPAEGTLAARRRMEMWGTVALDVDKFLAAYHQHVNEVREYFKSRPGDLLEMDLSANDGWEKLCAFLGRPVPNHPFPRVNVSRSPRRLVVKVRKMLGL